MRRKYVTGSLVRRSRGSGLKKTELDGLKNSDYFNLIYLTVKWRPLQTIIKGKMAACKMSFKGKMAAFTKGDKW